MNVKDVIFKSAIFSSLAKQKQKGTLSHAYLLLGADLETSTNFAKLLSALILCPNDGCFICETCRKIAEEEYTGVTTYNIDTKLNTEDVTRLVNSTYTKSVEGIGKIYIIYNADKLTPIVQNKLLKIYEEPPIEVTIILVAGAQSGILPTILSRATKVFIPPITSQDITKILIEEDILPSVAEIAGASCEGSIMRARKLCSDEDYINQFDLAFNVLLSCKKSKNIVNYISSNVFEKDKIAITLDIFELILSDVLSSICGQAIISTKNRAYDLKEIAVGYTPTGVAMSLYAINTAKQRLNANVGSKIVTEGLLLDILEAKHKWQ